MIAVPPGLINRQRRDIGDNDNSRHVAQRIAHRRKSRRKKL